MSPKDAGALQKSHRFYRKKLATGCHIGVGRFRILGEGGRGPNFRQAHDVVLTSMRRKDVASASFRRHVPTRFLINQCQIITFLILKYDNIVLQVPSNHIKVSFIIILPLNLVHL